MSRHQQCSTSAILARPWSPGLREPVRQISCTFCVRSMCWKRCKARWRLWLVDKDNSNFIGVILQLTFCDIRYGSGPHETCELIPFSFCLGIASDGLKGRVFEVSLADLQNDEVAFRKFKLITEDVQGKNCLTNFHGMDLTRDKMCSMVKKWQVMCILQLLYALTFCVLHCRKESTWVYYLLKRWGFFWIEFKCLKFYVKARLLVLYCRWCHGLGVIFVSTPRDEDKCPRTFVLPKIWHLEGWTGSVNCHSVVHKLSLGASLCGYCAALNVNI